MRRDPQGVRLFWALTATLGGGGLLAALLLPTWNTPPIASQEWGPPGLAMDTMEEVGAPPLPANALPFPVPAPVEDAGVPAGEAYGDVEVLADLDRAQFDRLMEAITAWVAPQEGCTFCHAAGPEGRPDHDAAPPPTFEAARAMLRMTRELNADPAPHLQPQGVTCFSCHRGRNIPPYTWYKAGDWPPPSERWFQKPPPWVRTANTIRDFLPREAFERFILEDHRAAGIQAREMQVPEPLEPDPETGPLFTRAENIYLFMMQMSDGLGVNCNFCHNSRAFADWSQSTPHRVTGWYAIRQTRRINEAHIAPLKDVLPPEALGPVGDPAKADCMTCHVKMTKPLGGVPMAELFPGLTAETD